MHITILPGSPRTAQATIRVLLADPSGPTVRALYRDLARVPTEFASHPRFEAIQGDVDDASSLNLSGTDAVFFVQPPMYQDIDTIGHSRSVAENVKGAIQNATSVKRLVYLSSMGAQYDQGVVRLALAPGSHIVAKPCRRAKS